MLTIAIVGQFFLLKYILINGGFNCSVDFIGDFFLESSTSALFASVRPMGILNQNMDNIPCLLEVPIYSKELQGHYKLEEEINWS